MKTITMNKAELVSILWANRKTHVQEYHQTFEAYKKAVVIRLQDMLGEFQESPENYSLRVGLQRPESQEKNYTMVIEMLENDINDTVELDQHEYQNYVNDEWTWSNQFAMSKTAYGID